MAEADLAIYHGLTSLLQSDEYSAKVRQMDLEEKLRFTAQELIAAESALSKAAVAYPALQRPSRAFGRIARAANRPLRIGILGESNSGKSSLANLLVGVSTLPALPVANTRLPTLLMYARAPFVVGLYETGERVALSASERYPQGILKRLEVGLPSNLLRSVEILDFPGAANVLLPISRQDPAAYGIDAAIWTTAATQAWRESERAHWLELPRAIRSRGLLAVTFCDMIAGDQDLKRLRARLENSASPHFRGISFVAPGEEDPAAAASRNGALFEQIEYLAYEFTAARLEKATAIARRVAKNALEKLSPESATRTRP